MGLRQLLPKVHDNQTWILQTLNWLLPIHIQLFCIQTIFSNIPAYSFSYNMPNYHTVITLLHFCSPLLYSSSIFIYFLCFPLHPISLHSFLPLYFLPFYTLLFPFGMCNFFSCLQKLFIITHTPTQNNAVYKSNSLENYYYKGPFST